MKSIVGKILYDRYRIVQQLSHNDWSTVYLAEDLAINSKELCKIEQLHPHYDHEILGAQSWQKVRQTFMAQGDILKNLSRHPQIPQLLAFFECDREFYLVREYIEGISLGKKLNDSLIDESEALVWLQDILGVLECIHQLGIAHLNIQPESLMEAQDGQKFLTNFAAIKNAILFDKQELSKVLNPDFSPDVQQSNSDVNSDLSALGKTIIYALTGQLSASIQANSSEVSSQKLTNLNHSPKADIRPELARVLNKMVVSHGDHSYQSATEILKELDFKENVVTFPPPFTNTSSLPSQSSPRAKFANHSQSFSGSSKLVQKIIWVLLSLPFIIASVIIFVALDKNSYRNFAQYTNSDYQFFLKYPETWSKRQIDDPITGEIVVFASPPETDGDLFAEKIYLAVEYLSSEPTSLEEYSKTVLNRINQTENSTAERYQDFRTTINNSPARTVIYSRQEGSLQLRQMESFTIKNNQVYIAIYTAEKEKFSKFYPTVKKIIDSWEIQ